MRSKNACAVTKKNVISFFGILAYRYVCDLPVRRTYERVTYASKQRKGIDGFNGRVTLEPIMPPLLLAADFRFSLLRNFSPAVL
jgi:hypothetical protein